MKDHKVIPSRRVRERFMLIYELYGAQRAVNFLARYYKIRRMKIALDGRRTGTGNEALYDNYKAYFKKKDLNRLNILHEFYHHIAYCKGWEIPKEREEREADRYVKNFLVK